MVEVKDEVHTPDLMKEVGFVSNASPSDSSSDAINKKSPSGSG